MKSKSTHFISWGFVYIFNQKLHITCLDLIWYNCVVQWGKKNSEETLTGGDSASV